MSEEFPFCPICQLPLKSISISPEVHVSRCMSSPIEEATEECILGVHCLSTDVFHYRDFSHKLLAEYRASSDFIPPDIDIKPSPSKKGKSPLKTPRRKSPRKRKTPDKSSDKEDTNGESDSDVEVLCDIKKPRRNLKYNSSSKSVNTKLNSKRSNSTQNDENSKPGKGKSKVPTVLDNLESNGVGFPDADDVPLQNRTSGGKLTVVNVKLNSGEEVSFSNSRPPSPMSSISISSNTGTCSSKMDESEFEYETASESASSQMSQGSKNKCWSSAKVVLKEATLKIPNANQNDKIGHQEALSNDSYDLDDCKSDSSIKEEEENSKEKKTLLTPEFNEGSNKDKVVGSNRGSPESKEDFENVIPVNTLDKELLKIKNAPERSTSVLSTVATQSEGTFESPHTSDTEIDTEKRVKSASPAESESASPAESEVIIPKKSRKPFNLSSSSDSEVPLSTLARKLNPKPNKPIPRTKNSTPRGKEKAGKILRTPKKSPVYLNGFSLKDCMLNNRLSTDTEKDSDSGKSSGSKGDSSFVPSNASSTNNSDSAYSAASSENLTSSSISTYTSSELSSFEVQNDPSFSEESDANRNRRKNSKKTPVKSRRKSDDRKSAITLLSSDNESSASEISRKELMLFGARNKSNSSVKKPKSPKKLNWFSIKKFQEATDSDVTDSSKSEWRTLLSKMRKESFPSDLKIDSEDSLTIASSCSSSDTSHASASLPMRQCPFYKRIPDTPFAVDAFQYWNIPGVKVYFLSHFHSDHYIGIKKSFSQPIYCTKITANLVHMKLRVDMKWLRILELNSPQIIHGVEVTALDANQNSTLMVNKDKIIINLSLASCPGSVMFLFSLSNGQNHLHVGDFRACKSMTFFPQLQRLTFSTLFLDTTYCSPQYCFPTQEEVIGKVIDIVKDQVSRYPRTLVVCGSYTIGKEKVFLGVAEALDCKVWARPEKQRVFTCLDDERINRRLVRDPRAASVHVLPMASIQILPLSQHLQTCAGAFTHVIGVKPTGWELNAKTQGFKVTSRDNITIYGVAYSEHSSFTELRDFVQFLQPQEIVPTVNMGSAASRAKMNKHFADWQSQAGQPNKHDNKPQQTKVSQFFSKSMPKT